MSIADLMRKADVRPDALQGKVAIVTGAGRGIGKPAAQGLALLGASVVVAEIMDTGQATADEIVAAGGRAIFVKTDVSQSASMEALRDRTLEAFGPADIFINNATAFTTKPLLDLTVDEWDRVFSVNLRGAFLSIKVFLPDMLRRRAGVMVVMESAEGMPYLAPYLASKVGLRSLSSSLAREIGDDAGVWAYCFGPGLVGTEGQTEAFLDLAPRYGMTIDEFTRNTGGQLMDVDICAAGLVGTVLYAREYHGAEAVSLHGLCKLGLSTAGERIDVHAIDDGSQETGEPVAEGAAHSDAVSLNRSLEDLIKTIIREYEGLTMFQRPIVKRMFQQGTGKKVEEWLALAEKTTLALQSSKNLDLKPYLSDLHRLSAFILKQESDAKGWIKNTEQLRVALEALRSRRSLVESLISSLSR